MDCYGGFSGVGQIICCQEVKEVKVKEIIILSLADLEVALWNYGSAEAAAGGWSGGGAQNHGSENGGVVDSFNAGETNIILQELTKGTVV